MLKRARLIALGYLLLLCVAAWGYAVGRYHIFPAQHIRDLEAFVAGHELEHQTTVADKVAHQLDLEPTRFIYPYPAAAGRGADDAAVVGLRARRDMPLMSIAPDHREGFRAIFGAFDFEAAFWGGVLIGPDGRTIHTWRLSTSHLSQVPDNIKNMYGLHVLPDGSVIFSHQEDGKGIVKVDACSNVVWNIPGQFHHTISATQDGGFWTFKGHQHDFDHVLAKYSLTTGEELQTIDMREVRARNPLLHIFNLQRLPDTPDTSHGNDIEPLPSSLADVFPGFRAGDLLLSYRTQNLVFVLDPETYEVKWWRIGAWDRQHDPDWEPDGRIYVFSNNQISGRSASDIVAIRPSTFEQEIVVDGSRYAFHSSINGTHQLSPFGTRMITSSTQGFAFEVDASGRPVFVFINAYDREQATALHLSEAMRLDTNYFASEFWKSCQS